MTLDLTREYPRSPGRLLGGYVHLARMIDKVRAKAAGTLGEYLYACPLDKMLLEFLGLHENDFYNAVIERNDFEILDWLKEEAIAHNPEAIKEWNTAYLNRQPPTEESWGRFLKIRNEIAPSRTDVTTWPDLLDLDEGREVPPRTPAA